GKNVVQKVGSVLASMPSRRFQVEGHTDDVPIANAQFPSNWELASARALGVVRSLLGSGMQTSQLSAASYGEFHPLMPNDSPRGRQANRRIEIVLLPDLSNVPGAGASEPLAER
ncbi:MAG TPA: OmpA family protein, partial [Polyangiales bacterium]|nr:OmpA family protein [Polyangiales bacterium]